VDYKKSARACINLIDVSSILRKRCADILENEFQTRGVSLPRTTINIQSLEKYESPHQLSKSLSNVKKVRERLSLRVYTDFLFHTKTDLLYKWIAETQNIIPGVIPM
jgi:hypothetical protein